MARLRLSLDPPTRTPISLGAHLIKSHVRPNVGAARSCVHLSELAAGCLFVLGVGVVLLSLNEIKKASEVK